MELNFLRNKKRKIIHLVFFFFTFFNIEVSLAEQLTPDILDSSKIFSKLRRLESSWPFSLEGSVGGRKGVFFTSIDIFSNPNRILGYQPSIGVAYEQTRFSGNTFDNLQFNLNLHWHKSFFNLINLYLKPSFGYLVWQKKHTVLSLKRDSLLFSAETGLELLVFTNLSLKLGGVGSYYFRERPFDGGEKSKKIKWSPTFLLSFRLQG